MTDTTKRYREPVPYKGSDYMVYVDGRVFSNKTNKFLSFSKKKKGYHQCAMRIGGRKIVELKHRLIALCYKPNPNPKKFNIVRHLNDIPDDNRLENLEWGTELDNVIDAIKNGGFHNRVFGLSGIKHPKSRLTEKEIYEIREKYDCGESPKKIGELYKIGSDHACRIGRRQQWKHLPEKI